MRMEADSAASAGMSSVAEPEPVGPAPVVRLAIRPLTKVLNPLVGRLAGRKHFRIAALIRHLGRRSGRIYATPAGARLVGDTIVIPLTFGSRSTGRTCARRVAARSGSTAATTPPAGLSSAACTTPSR
jgi:hypothetical protein